MIRHTRGTASTWRQAAGGAVELWCAPGPQDGFFAACAAEFGVALKAQDAGDPGERIRHGRLCGVLAGGDIPLLIGTDCPSVAHRRSLWAGRGNRWPPPMRCSWPADAGGYVLAGLRRAVPELFAGIARSGNQVMVATRTRARRAGRADRPNSNSLPRSRYARRPGAAQAQDARLAHLAHSAA